MSERWSLVSGPNNNNVNIKHSTPTLQMASRIILFTAPGKLVKTIPGNSLPADKETEAQGKPSQSSPLTRTFHVVLALEAARRLRRPQPSVEAAAVGSEVGNCPTDFP